MLIFFNEPAALSMLEKSDGDIVTAGYWAAVDHLDENPDEPDGHVVFHCVHQLCKELKIKTPNPDDVQLRLKELVARLAPSPRLATTWQAHPAHRTL